MSRTCRQDDEIREILLHAFEDRIVRDPAKQCARDIQAIFTCFREERIERPFSIVIKALDLEQVTATLGRYDIGILEHIHDEQMRRKLMA